MITRRRMIFFGIIFAIIIAGVIVYVVYSRSTAPDRPDGLGSPSTGGVTSTSDVTSEWDAGTKPPDSAVETAHRLASADLSQRRSALTPELNAALPPGGQVPPGSDIILDQDGWRQQDNYAVATDSLVVPGQPAKRIAIGFMNISGQWLVTFQENL